VDYLAQIDVISNRCGILAEELEELSPEHRLLKFDAEGKTDQEKDALLEELLAEFGPEGVDPGHIPSNQVLYETFLNFQAALRAAVLVKKAQIGAFRPTHGDEHGQND
jgi:hypothetical protein